MTASLIQEAPFSPLERDEYRGKFRAIVKDMAEFMGEIVVDNEPAYLKVTSLYKQARDWKKAVEGKRKELVEPFRSSVARINDRAKELTDPLDRVIELANAKVNGYQLMLAERKRVEDEKLRETADIFDAADELYIPPMEKTLRGEGAIAVTKTEKKFRVTDITRVPTKYLIVDEKSLMQDIKLGISEVPGIEIYETTTTNLRIR